MVRLPVNGGRSARRGALRTLNWFDGLNQEGGKIRIIFVERSDVARAIAAHAPLGGALAAPIETDDNEAPGLELAGNLAVFFEEFRQTGKQYADTARDLTFGQLPDSGAQLPLVRCHQRLDAKARSHGSLPGKRAEKRPWRI